VPSVWHMVVHGFLEWVVLGKPKTCSCEKVNWCLDLYKFLGKTSISSECVKSFWWACFSIVGAAAQGLCCRAGVSHALQLGVVLGIDSSVECLKTRSLCSRMHNHGNLYGLQRRFFMFWYPSCPWCGQ
jgi:hypothetical protein